MIKRRSGDIYSVTDLAKKKFQQWISFHLTPAQRIHQGQQRLQRKVLLSDRFCVPWFTHGGFYISKLCGLLAEEAKASVVDPRGNTFPILPLICNSRSCCKMDLLVNAWGQRVVLLFHILYLVNVKGIGSLDTALPPMHKERSLKSWEVFMQYT